MVEAAEHEAEGEENVRQDDRSLRMWTIWRIRFLMTAMGCAVVSLGLNLILHNMSLEDIEDLDSLLAAFIWLTPPLGALVLFFAAFICAVVCCRICRLLRHMAVVLCDAVVMFVMYLYRPWVIYDVEGGRIAYGFIWSPPMPRVMMLDGVYFASGRLCDQYMAIIVVSSLAIMWLTRESASELSPEGDSR